MKCSKIRSFVPGTLRGSLSLVRHGSLGVHLTQLRALCQGAAAAAVLSFNSFICRVVSSELVEQEEKNSNRNQQKNAWHVLSCTFLQPLNPSYSCSTNLLFIGGVFCVQTPQDPERRRHYHTVGPQDKFGFGYVHKRYHVTRSGSFQKRLRR